MDSSYSLLGSSSDFPARGVFLGSPSPISTGVILHTLPLILSDPIKGDKSPFFVPNSSSISLPTPWPITTSLPATQVFLPVAPPDSDLPLFPTKGHNGHVPRPRNAFIIFRSHFKLENDECDDEKRIQSQASLSRAAGERWRNLDDKEKDIYRLRASKEAHQHLLKYPGYRYNPRRAPRVTEGKSLKRQKTAGKAKHEAARKN